MAQKPLNINFYSNHMVLPLVGLSPIRQLKPSSCLSAVFILEGGMSLPSGFPMNAIL